MFRLNGSVAETFSTKYRIDFLFIGESYLLAEMQSAYSTTLADWVKNGFDPKVCTPRGFGSSRR